MKNNKSKVLLGAATLAAAVAQGAPEAIAATTKVTMTAQVLAAIQVTKTASLQFGSLTETAGGTVVVDNTGTRSKTGSVTLIGATAQAGGFNVKAASGVAYDITLPTTAKLAGTGGGSMTAQSFTLDGAGGPYTGLSQTVAARNFKLGGTLVVGAAQTTGSYSGNVTVTAVYQ